MSLRNLIQRNRPTSVAINRTNNNLQPISSLQNQINSMFNDFFSNDNWPFSAMSLPSFQRANAANFIMPSVNVSETDNEYRITAELPGINTQDIDIAINNNNITLSGEKSEENEDSGENYLVCERSYGSFQRSIPLPQGANTDEAQASFNDGVLTINIPKRAEAVSHSRKLEISQNRPAQSRTSANRSVNQRSQQSAPQQNAGQRINQPEPSSVA